MKKTTMIGLIIFVIGLVIFVADYAELSMNLNKVIGTIGMMLFAFRWFTTTEYCVKEKAEEE